MENGELLRKVEEDGYEVIVTTDQNMRYQQNLTGSRLAIVVLMATAWPRVQPSNRGNPRGHPGRRVRPGSGSPDLSADRKS